MSRKGSLNSRSLCEKILDKSLGIMPKPYAKGSRDLLKGD